MNQISNRIKMFGALLAAAALQFAVPAANAAILPFILTDRNSTASFDVDGSNFGAGTGQYSWTVDGAPQLTQQFFWYRVGGAVAGNPEVSLDTLPVATIGPLNADFDPGTETFTAKYSSAGLFDVTITYTLVGGTPLSGTSDIAETIAIDNLSGSSLDFHLFQYADFDLNGTPGNDSVRFDNANVVRQQDGSLVLSETSNLPGPDRREAALVGVTLGKLGDANGDDLAALNVGPFPTAFVGPGNVAWAYQWNFLIAPDGTVTISKDKNLHLNFDAVPEPGTVMLFGLGLGILYRKRRRS